MLSHNFAEYMNSRIITLIFGKEAHDEHVTYLLNLVVAERLNGPLPKPFLVVGSKALEIDNNSHQPTIKTYSSQLILQIRIILYYSVEFG